MKIRLLLCCLALLLLLPAALADTVNWPENVTVIEASMFEDDTALTALVVPENVTRIGDRAFANSGLQCITLPESLTEIGTDAFEGIGQIKVYAPSGSYAADYANKNLDLTMTVYPAGKYTIGTAMPAGTYIVRPTGTSKATVTLYDTTGALVIQDKSFSGNAVITVRQGERLTLKYCSAVVDYEFDQHDNLDVYAKDAMLRVGQDLPAGVYTVTRVASGSTAYARIYRDARYQTVSEESGFVYCDVTLTDGQLLCLRNARIIQSDGTTVYRAYLVGNTYSGTSHALGTGPINDTGAVKGMLGTMTGTPYIITRVRDVTASGILSGIRSAFAAADDDDVSLFFYSGHGMSTGKLVGNDFKTITPAALRSVMDEIPGKKIVLVDACYSGGLIQKSTASLFSASGTVADSADESESETTQAEVDAFADSLVSAFRTSLLFRSSGYLNDEPYLVLVASSGSEYSWQLDFGFFTEMLTEGCGWNAARSTKISSLYADQNADRQISLNEAYVYARDGVNELMSQSGLTVTQTVCVYPESCGSILFGR